MRAYRVIFTARVLCAAAALAAMSAYLVENSRELAFSGELLEGERSGAEGFALEMDALMQGHLFWESEYDPATGVTRTDSEWRLLRERDAEPEPAEPQLYLGWEDLNGGGSIFGETVSRSDFDSDLHWEIYSSLATELGSGRDWERTVKINGYTRYLPLESGLYGVEDIRGLDLAELLPVRLGRTYRVTVSQSVAYGPGPVVTGRYVNFSPEEEADFISVDKSWVHTDEWVYLVLLALDGEERPLNGSELPGGDWGVFRFPCEVSGGDGEFAYTLRCDFSAIENVYTFNDGWTDAQIFLDNECGRVQVLTQEPDGVWLTALDADSGAAEQRLKLFEAGDYRFGARRTEKYVLGGGVSAFVFDDRLLSLVDFSGGEYELLYSVSLDSAEAPERFRELLHGGGTLSHTVLDAARSGERTALFTRESGRGAYLGDGVLPEEAYSYRLLIYSDAGELLYNEWLTTQIADGNYPYGNTRVDIRLRAG